MSLRAPLAYVIPEQTIEVARAAFPKGNPYMRMRETLGPISTNPEFAHLFPKTGQPAYAPAQLALVTVMQFAEGLSDAQAAEAVRSRIDWKFALALELTDPGFDASVLCEFRARLLRGSAELLLFETMLTLFREQGLVKAKGRQRTDSTHVLAAIQVLNRLECIGETLRHALNILATAAPDWLQSWVPLVWFDRYSRRFEEYRLPPAKPARYALAEQIGADGRQLLRAVDAPTAPAWLRELPAVQTLRRVWVQQFHAANADERVHWRTAEDLPPPPLLISSPSDPDARYAQKRGMAWTGYKLHFTETCEEELPNLITDVLTTPATTSDVAVLPDIQQRLAARDVTPSEHIVDAGSMSSEHLLNSQQDHQIALLGPVGAEGTWQAQAGEGFAAAQFVIDWEAKCARCPQGKTSVGWVERQDRQGQASVQIKFAPKDCQACQVREKCTRSASGARWLQIRDREHHEVLQVARQRQRSALFQAAYAQRAGIEGTISEGVHVGDLRRSRYRGAAKTRLLHLLLAAGMNFMRVARWLAEVPRSRARPSAFAALGKRMMAAGAC